jgi:hypothetical protein
MRKRALGLIGAVAALGVLGAGSASAAPEVETAIAHHHGYHAPLVYLPVDVAVSLEDIGVGVLGAGVGELGNAIVGLLSQTNAVAD